MPPGEVIDSFQAEDWAPMAPGRPFLDDASAMVASEAIIALVANRTPELLGDSLADLHAMMSLLAQIRAWLPKTVIDAVGEHHPWTDVAVQLGVRAPTARRRYGPHVRVAVPSRATK